MLKIKKYSTKSDFKTGFLFIVTFFGGIVLILLFIFFKIITLFFNNNSTGYLKLLYTVSTSSTPDTIAAFSIVLIGLSLILYFFKKQFYKLDKIAEEIKNNDDFNNLQ